MSQSASASATPPTAADRPEHLCVVSDCVGYVGTFPSVFAAEIAVLQPHPYIPFIVQKFEVAPGPVDTVWVVLFRDLDCVAYVSNDRAEAVRMQNVYAKVGLAYDDDIDHWEQALGVITKSAVDRLESQTRAHRMYVGENAASAADELAHQLQKDEERLEALLKPSADGPLARAILENERISIIHAIVPSSFESAPTVVAAVAAVAVTAVAENDPAPAGGGS